MAKYSEGGGKRLQIDGMTEEFYGRKEDFPEVVQFNVWEGVLKPSGNINAFSNERLVTSSIETICALFIRLAQLTFENECNRFLKTAQSEIESEIFLTDIIVLKHFMHVYRRKPNTRILLKGLKEHMTSSNRVGNQLYWKTHVCLCKIRSHKQKCKTFS